MEVLVPITITPAMIEASSVAEDDAPAWDVGTTYAANADVTRDYKVYRSAVAGNLGNDPAADDGTNWTLLGAMNKFKPFDGYIADPAVDVDEVSYTINPPDRVDTVAMFGVRAGTIQVLVGDDVAFTWTRSASGINRDNITNKEEYYFSPIEYEVEHLFFQLPNYGDDTRVRVVLQGDSDVRLGQLVMGRVTRLGRTLLGAGAGIQDYSRKDRDTYGRAILVERDAAFIFSAPVFVEGINVRRVQRFIKNNRATPLVFIGNRDPRRGLVAYGFYETYSHPEILPGCSLFNIEVQELV